LIESHSDQNQKNSKSKIEVIDCTIKAKNNTHFILSFLSSQRNFGRKYFKLSVTQKSLYEANIVIKEITQYKTHISLAEISPDTDILII
jgi:hypothetical protein